MYIAMMSSKNTITITEARKRIFQLANDVQKQSSYYTLTEGGKAKAVLMSADEFDSWMETLEILSESPEIVNDVKEAREDYKKGKFITLDKYLEKDTKNVYGNPLKKGRKGPR